MDFKKISIAKLDLPKFTEFQKRIFYPLIKKSGSNSASIRDVEYLWKYKGAWKEGSIYLIENENKIIGSSGIVPYLMEDYLGNQFWCVQVFDNAVDQVYRKKNIFYELYDKTYRNEYGYTCFGFPNDNAIATILKFNGHIKEELSFWVKYRLNLPLKKSNSCLELSLIQNASQMPDFAPYIPSLSVRKDKNYIQWRYLTRPNRVYWVYKISEDNLEGFSYVILTTVTYRGIKIYLVLDAVGSNEYYYQNAIRLFMSKIDKRGLFVALTNDETQMKAACFLKIPPKLAPKRHYLVYTERDNTPFQLKSLTWYSSMGDWEVF
ncbi:MAG: hypothetical protein V4615_13635 [Bacteroidota bacterium]